MWTIADKEELQRQRPMLTNVGFSMKWCYFSIFVNNEKQYQLNGHHEHTPARPYPSHELLHSQITDSSPMFSIASQFPYFMAPYEEVFFKLSQRFQFKDLGGQL